MGDIISLINNYCGNNSHQTMYVSYLSITYTQYLKSNELLIICVLDLTSEDQILTLDKDYLTHIYLFKIKYLGMIT